MITVSAFRQVPPFAQGLVRDLRVRWALNEAGLAYRARLLESGEQTSPAYRALQPFGQVPAFEEDGLTLFESGSIVLHIGARSETLLPSDPRDRAHAITWVFAALNTIEVVVQQLASLDLFFADQDWARQQRPGVEKRVRLRLSELTARLADQQYLEGRFSAGDLVMTTVLRILRHTQLVEEYPALHAYQTRCEARPAFQLALAEQLGAFQS
ncbi:MAG: glutathione S-transferase family protein [Steroidobacterales bacterium]|jgi:glutathione S-transferase